MPDVCHGGTETQRIHFLAPSGLRKIIAGWGNVAWEVCAFRLSLRTVLVWKRDEGGNCLSGQAPLRTSSPYGTKARREKLRPLEVKGSGTQRVHVNLVGNCRYGIMRLRRDVTKKDGGGRVCHPPSSMRARSYAPGSRSSAAWAWSTSAREGSDELHSKRPVGRYLPK